MPWAPVPAWGRVAALAAFACGALLTAAHAQEPAPAQTLAERLTAALLPPRDPVDLAVRLRGVPADLARQPRPPRPPARVGQDDQFWVLDQRAARTFQVSATLRLVSAHAYWYVQDDRSERAPQADLERSARAFETRSYPAVERYFGPGGPTQPDGDAHIVFLLATVPGVAAYFSGVDTLPRAISPRSNERDMIYVNLDALVVGRPGFDATMAHELQHLIHFGRCPTQETWVDEGASELASRVAGYDGGPPQAFASQPNVQLTAWSTSPADLPRHYQAAYLFVRYVAERSGGWDALPELLGPCLRGEELFARYLAARGIPERVDDLFADWAVANLVNDPTVADGRYGYDQGVPRVSATGAAAWAAPFAGSVPHFAADDVELPVGTGRVQFSGDATAPLLAADVQPGQAVWWSNRADGVDTRLTRQLDLRGVRQATAHFRAWYQTEKSFDYVYLSGSRDGGATWTVLPGRASEPDGAVGNDYGRGWTGTSGGGATPAWFDEAVDLTPLAGSVARLRFDYVTDQAYNGEGFAFADFAVPELGLSEPGAADAAWTAEGWLRVDGPVAEQWQLRLVQWLPNGLRVDPVPVDERGFAEVDLDESASRAVLVVAPTARRTLQPAHYSLTAWPGAP